MPNAYELNHTGADWYDVFKLQEDLAVSYGLSVQITFEAQTAVNGPNMLCFVTIVGSEPGIQERIGAGTCIEVNLNHLRLLPRAIHESLSEVYCVYEIAELTADN